MTGCGFSKNKNMLIQGPILATKVVSSGKPRARDQEDRAGLSTLVIVKAITLQKSTQETDLVEKMKTIHQPHRIQRQLLDTTTIQHTQQHIEMNSTSTG